MVSEYRFLLGQICSGKSVLRSLLNWELRLKTLGGTVIDIGGGKNADYLSFMQRADDVSFKTFDVKAGDQGVDFEQDKLPAVDGAYDTVLFLNVMEHIFNYQHIASEVVRIVSPGGALIGFVPFLMWYHPDHHDFFRYTDEALYKIFAKTNVKDFKVMPVARGPFLASLHIRFFSYPRILRPVLFSIAFLLDSIYLKLKVRNGGSSRYVLGYLFLGSK